MKSKCLTLLLAGLLALSLCACGGTTAQTGTADIDALRTAMLDAAPADLPEMLLLDSSAAEETVYSGSRSSTLIRKAASRGSSFLYRRPTKA